MKRPAIKWNVGEDQTCIVREGGRLVCECSNPEDAALIVAAVNGEIPLTAQQKNDLILSHERDIGNPMLANYKSK